MANAREIQSRMKSIQDTLKITNAMYMISSTKLQKAKKSLAQTENYFFTLQNMISRILRHLPENNQLDTNPYFDIREKKAEKDRVRGYIVVTADKGLAGAYNHNVLKLAEEQMEGSGQYKLFVVGELGRQFFAAHGVPLEKHFHYTAQNPTLHRARIISETVIGQFLEGQLDEVYLIYTAMKNSMTTEPRMMQLLPMVRETCLSRAAVVSGIFQEEFVLEPSPRAVLNNIIPDTIMGYIYGALVESFCSEQNARMMAMEAANKSGADMLHDLSVQYNRVRQAQITQEITEVIAGAKAQKRKKKQKAGKEA